jgi:4-aminobutyrate aminotransferase
MDAISVGGERLFREALGPLLPGSLHVPPPVDHHCPMGCQELRHENCTAHIDDLMDRERDVGAVIAEPIRWSTVSIPSAEYWRDIRDICDRHGTLLIFDEIGTGLGRTGRMFACEHFGVVPDMLLLGKGLGGGLFPIASLIAHHDLDVAGKTAVGHFTHEKSPLGCAAALATLRVIEEEGLVEQAVEKGRKLTEGLRNLQDRHRLIGDVRAVGLLVGVPLIRDPGTREPAVLEAERVMYGCLSRGLSFKVSGGNVLTLVPPLTIRDDQIDRAVSILDASLAEAKS